MVTLSPRPMVDSVTQIRQSAPPRIPFLPTGGAAVNRSARPRLSRREVMRLTALGGIGAMLAGARGLAQAAEAAKPAGAAAQADAAILKPIPVSGEKLPVIGLGTNNYSVTSPEDLAPRREVLKRMPELGASV